MAKRIKPPGKWMGPRKDIPSAKGQKAYDAVVERNRKAGVTRDDIYSAGVAKSKANRGRELALRNWSSPQAMAARKLELQQQRDQQRADLIRRTLAQDRAIKRGWGL